MSLSINSHYEDETDPDLCDINCCKSFDIRGADKMYNKFI